MPLPLHHLIARNQPELLVQRFRSDPEETIDELISTHLAGWGLEWLDGEIDDTWRTRLQAAHLQEFGWTAKQKQTLLELDADAVEQEVFPLLVKGGATSRFLYAKESHRWSGDIDLMLPKEELRRLFPVEVAEMEEKLLDTPFEEHHFMKNHIGREDLVDPMIEWHHRIEFRPSWGATEQLLEDARKLPGFQNLRIPSMPISFSIVLLHLLKHRDAMPFDVIDCSRMLRRNDLDIAKVADIWCRHGLLPFMFPPLAFVSRVAEVEIPAELAALAGKMTARERRIEEVLTGLLNTPGRLSRWSQWRFECLLMGIPFVSFCLRQFLGTRRSTARMTGHSIGHPFFWWHHLLWLPIRRIIRIFTKS